jgi:hypothetical protein
MTITEEYLRSEMNNIRKQYENAVNVANKAQGALLLCESLLDKLREPEVEEVNNAGS